MNDKKTWILIADDEDEIRSIVREALSSRLGRDVRIVDAKDGHDAANKLTLQAFDCIITDLQMPKKDGGTFIRAVKTSQFNAKTPVIVLTGFPDENITQNFAHITMLEKPIKAKVLVQEVEKQLKLGRTDQRVAAHLLNDFIEATQIFLKSTLSETPIVETPKMKTPKSALAGEVICSMVIREGETVGRFAIGFTTNMLLKVGDILLKEKAKGLAPEVICKVIGQMMFTQALKPEDESAELLEIFAFKTEHHKNYQKLISAKGIIVELVVNDGKMFAQALSGDTLILNNAA